MAEANKTEKTRFAIIAALESEEALLRAALKNRRSYTILSAPVFRGTVGGHEVILLRSGMGKVSAAIGAQMMISRFRPDLVINTGCAGALSGQLGIGDMVVSDRVAEWDLDLTPIGYPMGYIDALKCVEMQASAELADRIRPFMKGHVMRGLIVSGDQFVSAPAQRQHILHSFPDALCTEMEGAAIGQVCCQNGVPFCVLRAISDTADGSSGVDFAAFAETAGRQSAACLIDMLTNT